MLIITGTEEWRTMHAGAAIGLLELSGVDNTRTSAALDEWKRATESLLREHYGGLSRREIQAEPVMDAYRRYYKRFNKTYHVQLQLESLVFKDRGLPDVSPLVDANFAAELRTSVLTAGHDAERLREELLVDVSREGDRMIQLGGTVKEIRPGDMVMRNGGTVVCSIIYGQDSESAITRDTSHALYVAYAPAGVPAEVVEAQLAGIAENVRLFSPGAVVEQRRILGAS